MKIILASKSGVRKKILDKYKIDNEVVVSNVDENEIKESLLAEGANPLSISKNLGFFSMPVPLLFYLSLIIKFFSFSNSYLNFNFSFHKI